MAFKSEKDREAYVGKLRAAGFSPEEIDADVAEIQASQPTPAPVAPPPVSAQPNLQPPAPAEAVKALAEVAQARNQQNQDLTGQVLGNDLSQAIKDLSGSNLGKVGLAAAGGYGLYKAGRLAERKFGPSSEMDVSRRVEPTMEPVRESARLPAAAQQSGLSEADQALLAKSEANRIAKEQESAKRAAAAPPAPIPEPPAFIRNQPPVAEVPVTNPKVPALLQAPAGAVAPPVSTSPVAAPVVPVAPAATVAPAPTVAPPVAVAETPAPIPTQAEVPPKKEPKAAKAKIDMPSGWGKGMSWLTHQYGVEGAQSFIDQYNKGKPYGTYDEMMKAYTENTMRPKYSDIPKGVRQERGITSRSGTMAVPPPSLRPTDLSQGGSLIRSLTDPLQLKQ